MKYWRIHDKESLEYQENLVALREFERNAPMTLVERDAIRCWVRHGHNIDSNPWEYCDCEGEALNYLEAYRIRYGYARGPWDNWRGVDHWKDWDDWGA